MLRDVGDMLFKSELSVECEYKIFEVINTFDCFVVYSSERQVQCVCVCVCESLFCTVNIQLQKVVGAPFGEVGDRLVVVGSYGVVVLQECKNGSVV